MVFKILCCILLLFGGTMENKSFDTITGYFDSCACIVVYDDGQKTTFNKGDQKYEEILGALKHITNGAYDMPAFGVSLDKETRKSLNSGFWIELVYESEQEHNGMPFSSLLIEINKDYSGFNLIRQVNGKYEGRCFYLQLQENMEQLFNTVENISKNK